jgi:hypothetical protein
MWGWLLLAIACGAVAYGVSRTTLGYPPPLRPYRRLGRGEAAFLESAAESLYPPGGSISSSGAEADLPGYVDRLMDASHRRIRLMIHLLFFLVEHATILFPAPGRGGRRRFSALGPEQQLATLNSWADNPRFFRRVVFTSLRALLTMGYFAHAPVLRQLRLAPLAIDPPVCEADLWYPPIGKGPEAIPFGRSDLTPASDGTPLDPDGPIHPRYGGVAP